MTLVIASLYKTISKRSRTPEDDNNANSKGRKLNGGRRQSPEYRTVDCANRLPLSTFKELYFPAISSFSNLRPPDAVFDLYKVTLHSSDSLTTNDFDACFSLIEQTSSHDYKNSSGGWHPETKKVEMKDKDMKFLIVRRASDNQDALLTPTSTDEETQDGSRVATDRNSQSQVDTSPVLAFLSFVLTSEPPFSVLYVYEIHLLPSVRRVGLGAHLMGVAGDVARAVGVDKTMLTVFTANPGAYEFYRRLGYSVDVTSPPQRKLRRGKVIEPEYKILSKPVEIDQKT